MPDTRDYTVGWICALSTERVAAEAFLDEIHDPPDFVSARDNNDYTLGRIGKHNVAIASLPDGEYGLASAATVASDLMNTFLNVKIGLMVGIGGGVPSKKHDIRLGDVVVSAAREGKRSVFQYDFGKSVQGQEFQTTGILDQPPRLLRAAVGGLRSYYEGNGNQIEQSIQKILDKKKRLRKKYGKPEATSDRLFLSHVVHPDREDTSCTGECSVDMSNLVVRRQRDEDDDSPAIHYGSIASGNTLMKDAQLRDKLAEEQDILCFEMEAAGLANNFPCLIIRGICDYSDSHKNKEWQGYAAMTAAAYAKDILLRITPNKVEAQRRLQETIDEVAETVQNGTACIKQLSTSIHEVINQSRVDDQIVQIWAWIKPSDPSVNINLAREKRHTGTGTWLLDNPMFEKWAQQSHRHIWLHGLSGSGKTVLSTTVIDHLKDKLPAKHTIVCFFFDFTTNSKQHISDLVRSLIFQIYFERPEVRSIVNKERNEHKDGTEQPSMTTLSKILANILQFSGKTYIILDALDECIERVDLLVWLNSNLLKPGYADTHVLLTGRPAPEFENHLRPFIGDESCIPVDIQMVNRDIQTFVEVMLRTDPGFLRWKDRPEVLEKIQQTILEKVAGMFRLAACQLDLIRQSLDLTEIEEHLSSLPQTLQDMYDRVMLKIPANRKDKAMRLLQFLVFTKRPLTLDESVDLMAITLKNNGGSFEEKRRMPDAKDIMAICPDLISLFTDPEYEVEEVRLSHFSVKEYFLEKERLGFSQLDAAITITHCCLAYLGCLDGARGRAMTARYPLAKYAAQIWAEQAALVQHDKSVERAVMDFFTNDSLIKTWSTLYSPDEDKPREADEPTDAESLYFASLQGMDKFVMKLVSVGFDLNAQGGRYNTALQAASLNGHHQIVQLLIEKGADINAQGGQYHTALQAASLNGHHQIVQLFIEKGAEVNCQGGQGNTALQAASENGHQHIVQVLLDNGADVNAQGGRYNTALQAASYDGHLQVIQLLLENGAEINAQGGYKSSALEAASYKGHHEIVQLLLEKGAAINAQGNKNQTALQAASEEGHEQTVKILLDNGADANLEGERWVDDFRTALQAASYKGHEQIVQLLLDGGANINAKGGFYGTALQAACHNGEQKTAQLLLERGADINAQAGGYISALQTACFRGKLPLAQFLLDKGADVKAHGGYNTALQQAVYNGNLEMVQVLLEKGAEIDVQPFLLGAPIQIAVDYGHREIFQLLLEKGASIIASGPKGWTAIHHASVSLNTEFLGVILEKELELCRMAEHEAATISPSLILNQGHSYLQDKLGRTPLFLASRKGNLPAVQALIDKHLFSVNVIDWHRSSALTGAVRNGHSKVVELLLGCQGIQIDLKDGFGRTLIWWAKRLKDPRILELLFHCAEERGIRIDEGDDPPPGDLLQAGYKGNFSAMHAYCHFLVRRSHIGVIHVLGLGFAFVLLVMRLV